MGSHRFEDWIAVKFLTGTTNGTAGTRSNHAHGLGKDINMYRALAFAESKGDNDTNDAAAVNVVKTDATNVVVKASQTSVPILIVLLLDKTHLRTAASFPAELR